MKKTIEQLMELQKRMKAYIYASSIFEWDQATGATKKGVATRAIARGVLAGDIYAIQTSDEMKQVLEVLEANKEELDLATLAMVRECRKDYDDNTKIPKEEVMKYTEVVANAESAWEKAKDLDDFEFFKPHLEEIVSYTRKFIDYRGYTGHPYNKALDDFEPGMTVEMLDQFFEQLKETIIPLIKKIDQEGQPIKDEFLHQSFSCKDQERLSIEILKELGFDFEGGMLKESEHPFTLDIGADDVRLTTHYYEDNLMSAVLSTIHEGGHGIYEQGVSRDYAFTVLEGGVSMAVHESQSRFFENLIGRSKGYVGYILPKIKSYFPQLEGVKEEAFYKAINIAKPSLIRTEADELTYCLHIIIRYEIEKALIGGEIEVEDLPKVWNEKYESYMGITPPTDSVGVLQDTHWSSGLFGYFPSYAVGTAYASQVLHAMEQDVDFDQCIEKGDFAPIVHWLNEKIHQYGGLKSPGELMKEATGEELNPKYFTDYLEKKFGEIYFK
ncbi:MAG TPA: carboxypeptidase M32 [Epulopiscium sp.]|nr:carboxypeptidase M32 [Candidatus Epulonipiscium sp.]